MRYRVKVYYPGTDYTLGFTGEEPEIVELSTELRVGDTFYRRSEAEMPDQYGSQSFDEGGYRYTILEVLE